MMGNLQKFDDYKDLYNQTLPVAIVRLYLLIPFSLNLIVLLVKVREAYGVGSIFGFSGSRLLALWPYFLVLLALLGGVIVSYTHWSKFLTAFAQGILNWVSLLGFFNWVLFVGIILVYGMGNLAGIFESAQIVLPPIWIFGHLGLLGAIFLSGTKRIKPNFSLLVSFSVYGLMLWVVKFIPDIHHYPLSLGWSETSRFYYASLFFSSLIYGKWVPLSSLHPTRYLLQSLPFIVPSLPLWFHRLWQVLLWLCVTFGGGLALARRFKFKNNWISFGLAAWFFLFNFQGPVYYHLMIIVIIVLLGFRKEKLMRSLVFVVLASLWAGISRINWFPVAGILAVTLYVLEVNIGQKSFWQYWRWPIIAVFLGFGLAFVSQAGYAIISGNPPEVFVSSINSPLFRYRLFPNEAFGPGIVNMTITAIFPLLAVFVWKILPNIRSWHFLRLIAIIIILIVLLIVGFIVSTKIGGGDNLHNLDSFMVVFAVVSAYVGFNYFLPDNPERISKKHLPIPLVVIAFLIPLIFVLDVLRPYPDLDSERAWKDIQQLQLLIDENTPIDGEILFIDQRHLLTFNMIEGVELVPEYEKVFLMEMAMSNNEVYLSNFWRDLEIHRFDFIVSSPLTIVTKTSLDVFGEENNVWVKHIAHPVLDYYQTVVNLEDSGISLMAPKKD